MNTLKQTILVIGLLLTTGATAQTIVGKVTNQNSESLIGASVYWLDTTIGTTTGENGEFEISIQNNSSNYLIASYVGHISDTIEYTSQSFLAITLEESQFLDEITITEQQEVDIISYKNPIKT